MNVKCAQCGTSFFVMNTSAGKKVKCGHCGAVMVAPAVVPAAAGKPMFKPGALKLPPKPQLKAGLKLATRVTPPTPAPVAVEPAPTSVAVEPAPAPAPVVVEPPPAPAPVAVEPAPAPAPVAVEPPPAPAPVAVEPAPAPVPVAVEPAPAPVAAAPAPAADMNELAARLGKLKSLYEMGLISEEEHRSQRARILAEI